MVNSTIPSTTGNHAPCSSLAPLAITKPRSMMKNTTQSLSSPSSCSSTTAVLLSSPYPAYHKCTQRVGLVLKTKKDVYSTCFLLESSYLWQHLQVSKYYVLGVLRVCRYVRYDPPHFFRVVFFVYRRKSPRLNMIKSTL